MRREEERSTCIPPKLVSNTFVNTPYVRWLSNYSEEYSERNGEKKGRAENTERREGKREFVALEKV